MRYVIKGIFVTAGVSLILVACMLTCPNDSWYVPAVIGLVGSMLIALAILIERQQDKPEKKRHKVIDVWIDDEHITMPAPLTDFEMVYLSTLGKEHMKNENTNK